VETISPLGSPIGWEDHTPLDRDHSEERTPVLPESGERQNVNRFGAISASGPTRLMAVQEP
jgi:hypothetical protein